MKTKLLTILGLLIYCLIIILPPIIHGYVYPNIGDDSAVHLKVLDMIKLGISPSSNMAIHYYIIGYPIVWISNLMGLSVDVLFLWFSYLSLALIGITIYFLVSKLVSKKAGWLALILTTFCTQGLLFQFYYGQIFNAINMGIILPILLFFTVRYFSQKRVYQLVLVILLSGLFASFHICGIYLPFIAGFSTVVYVAYKLFKKEKLKLRIVCLGAGLVLLPIIAFSVSTPNVGELWQAFLHIFNPVMAVPIANYMMDIISPSVLLIVALIVVFSKDILKDISEEGKALAFLLSCMAIVLAVSAFAKISLDPFRQALDFATVLALLVAVLVSMVASIPKNKLVSILLVLIIGFGLYHNLPTWFGYNSAIRQADREAIAYVNTLNLDIYNCSAEVAPWIYDRFTEPKYKSPPEEGGIYAPILIKRDTPMTPRGDPENMWYERHGLEPDDNYVPLKSFSDNKVTVTVYEYLGEQ